MKQLAIPTLFISALLGGCAGNSLTPQSNASFTVTSQPSGATVSVMGKEVGTTPLELASSQVFPLTYPLELQAKYGSVELRHSGCEPYRASVSTDILAEGLNAKLNCEQAAKAPPANAPATTVQERLRELKAIFDEGLISEEEYRSKREALLQEL
jgi:hypothetical protein